MFELAKAAGYLLSPLTLVLLLGLLAALCVALRRPRWAMGLGTAALAGLWIASLPVVAQLLVRPLEARYPPPSVQDTPSADAILVLGGALAGAWPPRRPALSIGPSIERVWHAAALYRAGKGKWVVIAGGNQPGTEGQQAEADAIAEVLQALGVPPSAIKRDRTSRNTRENAINAREVLDALGVRRVLLVTSALHMPRAVKTFTKNWASASIQIVPVSTDQLFTGEPASAKLWLPSLESLLVVTKALKEYAGMASLAII